MLFQFDSADRKSYKYLKVSAIDNVWNLLYHFRITIYSRSIFFKLNECTQVKAFKDF